MSPLEGLPEPPAGTEPERVYHYTDAGGLLGIVKNKGLWASDVWFMNDAREAEYGLDVIERVLISRTLASGAESEVCRKAADFIRSVRDQNDLLRSYIACLSKEGDQLSQWQAYGRPRGFSIGFDRVSLRRLYPLVPQLSQPIYRDVSYDETEQDNNIAIRLNTALERLPTTPSGGDLDQAASAFVMDALLLVPAFKDPAFEDEREVRLQIFHLPSSGANDLLCFLSGGGHGHGRLDGQRGLPAEKRDEQSLVLAGTPLHSPQQHAQRTQRDETAANTPHRPSQSVQERRCPRTGHQDRPVT